MRRKHVHVFMLYCGPKDEVEPEIHDTWRGATEAAQVAANDNGLGVLHWEKLDEDHWRDFSHVYSIQKVILQKRGNKR
jgi:hypothetical protein